MVSVGEVVCPLCGGQLKRYDCIPRIVRTKGRVTKYVKIQRLKCQDCQKLHNELPDFIFPYKQYEIEVIRGVVEGIITADTLGFEDYPCEMTMLRWCSQKKQFL